MTQEGFEFGGVLVTPLGPFYLVKVVFFKQGLGNFKFEKWAYYMGITLKGKDGILILE